jgi:hypothetical protein
VANFTGIAAVGSSIIRYLKMGFKEIQPIPNRNTSVLLIRTEDMNRERSNTITIPALTLLLYKIGCNSNMRASWASVGHRDGESHLPLDLHFLLTAWGDNPEHEHLILGRAMQCIENMPIFSGPLLDPVTDWTAHESVQISMDDLSTEDIMRTFDSLPVDFKLSVPYVVKIVVIDGRERHPRQTVTTAIVGTAAEVET